jgi:hypothetical protein
MLQIFSILACGCISECCCRARWVLRYVHDSADNCANNCANNPAYTVHNNDGFRLAVFALSILVIHIFANPEDMGNAHFDADTQGWICDHLGFGRDALLARPYLGRLGEPSLPKQENTITGKATGERIFGGRYFGGATFDEGRLLLRRVSSKPAPPGPQPKIRSHVALIFSLFHNSGNIGGAGIYKPCPA